jgi:hypothetical protein
VLARVSLWHKRMLIEVPAHSELHVWCLSTFKTYPSIVSLKALSCPFPVGMARVDSGEAICHQQSFLFCFFFLSSLKKLQFGPLCCWYFNFSHYSFDLLIFVIGPVIEAYLFSISSFNPNLSYIYFFQFGSHSFYFLWVFC